VVLESVGSVDVLVVTGGAVERQHVEIAALLDLVQHAAGIAVDAGGDDQDDQNADGGDQAGY
jgi:hypothetical protein